MTLHEIEAKTILRKAKRIDSWFVSRCGMNLYRGCRHDCVYCDGRSEKYHVEGVFGRDIQVKVNALALLERDLDPARRRKPFPGGFVTVGGGVCDTYQPAETDYRLTRRALELLARFGHPVHVLTKSTLVLRDIDLLAEINRASRAIVSFSFSSVDEKLARVLEPGVPPPAERLAAVSRLKERGIACGFFLMPIIPLVTDGSDHIEKALAAAKASGADFALFGGLTLKEGRQKEHFIDVLKKFRPEVLPDYERLYPPSPWGAPDGAFLAALDRLCFAAARDAGLPPRMPLGLFTGLVSPTERAVVLLDHLDYAARCQGRANTPGRAAHAVAMLGRELEPFERIEAIRGVGPAAAKLIGEILRTGSCAAYEEIFSRPRPAAGNYSPGTMK